MTNELYHHGILGQKWGVRRWQNEDGSYKPGGAERYYTPSKEHQKETYKKLKKAYKKNHDTLVGNKEFGNRIRSEVQQYITPEEIERLEDSKNKASYGNFERKRNGMKGYEEAKGMPDPGYSLTEKGENDFWDAQDKDYEECKKVAQRILGEFGDKKVSSKSTKTYADLGAAYLQANVVGVTGWDEIKRNNPGRRAKQIEKDSSHITDQVSKELVSDIKRWDSNDGKSKSKEDYSKIKERIQKQLSKELENYSNNEYLDATDTFKDGTITFGISGFSDYSGSAPLTVDYNPKTKKVVNIYYT